MQHPVFPGSTSGSTRDSRGQGRESINIWGQGVQGLGTLLFSADTFGRDAAESETARDAAETRERDHNLLIIRFDTY